MQRISAHVGLFCYTKQTLTSHIQRTTVSTWSCVSNEIHSFIAKWIGTLILSNQLDEIYLNESCSTLIDLNMWTQKQRIFVCRVGNADKNRKLFVQIYSNQVGKKQALHSRYDFQHNGNVNVFHSTSKITKNKSKIIVKTIGSLLIFLFGTSSITHF